MKTLRRLAMDFDTTLGRAVGRLLGPRNKLITLAFHAVTDFTGSADLLLNPDYRLSVDGFRDSVRFYLDRGFRPASLADVLAGLDPKANHVMFTFDDGYANFLLALPVLEEFGVPALFSIATHFVESGEAFWWDAHHRYAIANRVPLPRRQAESWKLNGMSASEVAADLRRRIGPEKFQPLGEADRPLTIDELRELAAHPLVTLANHTARHPSMTACSPSQTEAEIVEAQRRLREWTGQECAAFVAPFGHMTEAAAAACRKAGIQAAFALGPGRQYLPLDLASESRWLIPRLCIRADVPLEQQLERSLLDWSPAVQWRQQQNPPGVFFASRFGAPDPAPSKKLVHAGIGAG